MMSDDDDIPIDPGYEDFGHVGDDIVAPAQVPPSVLRLVPKGEAPRPTWEDRVTLAPREWFGEAPKPRTWLLRDRRTGDGVLPVGKVGMLIGEGGVSKTMALIALGLAVATGSDWLGTYSVTKPGRVLMILGEEDAEEVHRRLYHAGKAGRVAPPELGSVVVLPLSGVPCTMIETDNHGNPQDAAFLLWLRGYVKASGPFDLIIVDPLSRFAGVDAETDNAAATRFVQALESLATETGADVIVCHHTNKTSRQAGTPASGAAARGSSAFYDGVRWAAALTAERVKTEGPEEAAHIGEVVTLTVVKSNYSMKGDPLLLRRDREHGGALVPLDQADLETVAASRANALDKDAHRKVERRRHHQAVVDAIRDVLRAMPERSGRQLYAAVLDRLQSCSRDTFDTALASISHELTTMPGTKGATLHSLRHGAA